MVWLSKTLRTQEEIDNFKEHDQFKAIGMSSWFGGKATLNVSECDKYFKRYNEPNKFWEEVYTRTTGFVLWVRIPEIPREELVKEIQNAIKFSDVTEYTWDTCLDNFWTKTASNGAVAITWADSDHNPEWVAYDISNRIYRAMLYLARRYAPALAKAEENKRKV